MKLAHQFIDVFCVPPIISVLVRSGRALADQDYEATILSLSIARGNPVCAGSGSWSGTTPA